MRFHCPVFYSIVKNMPDYPWGHATYAPYEPSGEVGIEARCDEYNTNDACYQAHVDTIMFGFPPGIWCAESEKLYGGCSTRGTNNCQSLNLDATTMQTPTRYYCNCGEKQSEQECLDFLPGAHEQVCGRVREGREREREGVAKRGRGCVCACVRA